MKKLRAFRLGKRLVRVWRWVRPHRRLKHTPYVPLTNVTTTTTTPPSPSRSPHLYRNHHRKTATAVTAKLADWGRSITRRFGPSSRACPRHAAPPGGEEDDHLLPPQLEKGEKGLHRRRRRPKQQQGEAGEEVEGEGAWWKPPPKGYLAVYVGRKGVEPPRRVLVPVVYFNHPLFGELLRGAEEEFGFHHPGGISIPCPVADFESVRRRVAAAAAALGSRRCRTADGWRYRLWVMRR